VRLRNGFFRRSFGEINRFTNAMRLLLLLFLITVGVVRAQQPESATTFFLVRHAEKADLTDASPLTERGKARADKLAEMVRDADVRAVYSTNFVRTRETARPLAEKRGLTVQTYDGKDEGFAKTLLKAHAGQRVLVVGHSNTIPKLINALAGTNLPNLTEAEYDALFVVTVPKTGPPTVLTLRFDP